MRQPHPFHGALNLDIQLYDVKIPACFLDVKYQSHFFSFAMLPQIHHVAYCFIVAYATERTMILESKRWQYASSGWESVFLPISSSCTEASGESS